jgi:hypothetical protein
MATIDKLRATRWHTNVSAVQAFFKVPAGWAASGYFYTGPTLHFGHAPAVKKKKS